MAFFLLSLLLCLSFPIFARWAYARPGFPRWLSPIVACYLIGILISNLRLWPVVESQVRPVAEISMLLALPLLLFTVRLRESLRYTGKMLLGFGLCCFAGMLCTLVVGWQLSGQMEDSWKISGMLTGLYTGGTPNVNAIGIALGAPPEYLTLIQAADILLGGAYLLGLISFLPALFARIYPPWQPAAGQLESDTSGFDNMNTGFRAKRDLRLLAWTLLVVGLSLGLTYLITGGLENGTLIILSLTSFGLLIGNLVGPDQLGESYPLGEYFILVFCVALGLQADFRALADQGIGLLYFSALALGAATLLHLILSKWAKLDRDTVILSSVAAFYGPAFVVQVAAALKNQQLMAAGLAVSLFGFGIGNYLGIGVAYLVQWMG